MSAACVCRVPKLTSRSVAGLLQQCCRWNSQCLCEATNVQQRNIALPALHPTQIATGQPAFQRKALLRESLGLPDFSHPQSEEDAGISGLCFLRHEETMEGSPLSGHAL